MHHFLTTRLRRRGCFAATLFVLTILLSIPMRAQQPQPDPTGAATGDRTTAIDGAGNSFVVPDPDKADPDYVNKKKAYDDYQAQLAKEPLAAKVADVAGHVRIATNAAWTLNTGYLVLFMQAGFATGCSRAWWPSQHPALSSARPAQS